MPKLLVTENGQTSVLEPLDGEATIGRGGANAIQIADGHASKLHAVVRRVGGRMKLIDLESKNGTRVNGELRNQRWLQHGDEISVGAAVLTYDASEGVEAASAPAEALLAAAAEPAQAAPEPLVSRSARPSRAARSTRRDRDGDDGEDGERPRRVAKRSSNSTMVAVLVGGGLIAVVAGLFLLLGGKGNSRNVTVLAQAKQISARGGVENAQAALDHLLANGDPNDVDSYKSVEREIGLQRDKVLSFGEADLEDKALAEYNALERAFIEKWKPNAPKTEEQIGQDLVKWVRTYEEYGPPSSRTKGRAVAGFLAGYKNPNLLNLYLRTKSPGAPK